jgi:threonine/homoserine/homoserine lactone efflux protein
MSKYFQLFAAAFSISFLGSIPVGSLNTGVANYVLNHNLGGAVQFGLGAIVIEMLLVRLAVTLTDKLKRLQKLFYAFSFIMCVAVLLLAFITLEAAFHMKAFQEVVPLANNSPFISGLLLSLINPLHLPFWMGWTAVLYNKKLLNNSGAHHNIYILAIGAGTAISFLIYGLAGRLLTDFFRNSHHFINWILGITFLVTGLIVAYKLVYRKITLV